MAYNILLRRDSLNCPRLCVTFEETLKVTGIEETHAINQLMHINCNDFSRSSDERKVNLAVDKDVSVRICEAYGSPDPENQKEKKCTPDVEMVIAPRHEQPVSLCPYRLSSADRKNLQKKLDELFEKAII